MTDQINQAKKISLPVQMAEAPVSDIDRPISQKMSFKEMARWITGLFGTSFLGFCLRRGVKKILLISAICLLIILVLEAFFWFWVWQLPPEKFRNLTACLDAGVVPSLRERFIYHMACFMGNI